MRWAMFAILTETYFTWLCWGNIMERAAKMSRSKPLLIFWMVRRTLDFGLAIKDKGQRKEAKAYSR